MRVLVWVGCGRSENSDHGATDGPGNLRGGPFDSVCDEVGLVVGSRIELSSVEGGDISLSKIIRLNLCTIGSQPLHIDLVKVV